MLKETIEKLQKENALNKAVEEHARYKRRWNLRLTGLPEKDGENTREIASISEPTVRHSGYSHYAWVNPTPRQPLRARARAIIIQFGMRTVQDEVWKKLKEARVCNEMHIQFREDFSKEDREARSKLWPMVQEARKKGKRAFLKEGYALIDNRRVDPI